MKPFSPIFQRFYQVCSLVLALHFFNMSIDPKDLDPDSIPEDLTLNDIESMTELLAEVVFGWEDVFSEHDEADSEDGGTVDFSKYYFSTHSNLSPKIAGFPATVEKSRLKNSNDIDSLSRDIISPPPEV